MLSVFIYSLLTFFLVMASPFSYSKETESSEDEQETLFSELPSVYTASRHEQPVTKAPAAVDIITAEQIKRYGWRTVSAMLGSLPGFLDTYDRLYDHVGVRGLSLPNDYNIRILVLIDGHRVNENLQDYAGLGQDFLLDVNNIERVEVVRGPGSALYGSSALLAVVNVITQRGRDIQGTRVTADVASYDTQSGQISHGKKFGNGFESLFSASYYHNGGQENLTVQGPTGGTSHFLDGQQVQRFFGKVAYNDLTLSGGYMGRKKYLPTGINGLIFDDAGTFYHDQRTYADLNYQHHFEDDWDLTGRLFWDRYQFDDGLPFSDGSTPPLRIVNNDQWSGQWFGSEFLLSHTFFDSHRFTAGGEFRRNYQQIMTNQNLSPYLSLANTNLSSNVYGAFLQDEWTIKDNLHLQMGGRYDHYDSVGGTLNPRLGLVYEPIAGTNLKLLFGTAFRAPNAFETMYTCCSSTWVCNFHLKPEKMQTYEFVWEQRLNKNFDLRVSPFYNQLTNLIHLAGSGTLADPSQFQNYASVDVTGLESLVKGHYEDIEGFMSYTYQQSTIAGNNNPANVPTHMFKVNITAPIYQDKLFTGLENQYISQRATVAGGHASAYIITNLNLISRHLLPGVELTGGMYNVFDVHYVNPVASPISADVISQDGRNFRLRVNYEF